MTHFIPLVIWVITSIAVLFFSFANAQEFHSHVQHQVHSAKGVENEQFGLGSQKFGYKSTLRGGGTIRYKKISVMKSGSGLEKSGIFEVAEIKHNTRRLKPKTSNRQSMIYRPMKKTAILPKNESLGLSLTTTKSQEVKVLPGQNQNYETKSWPKMQTVTEIFNSFIRPTKRNRVRVDNRPWHETLTTSPAPKITLGPIRLISRVRIGNITATTLAPTTSQFLRLSRKPSRWQSSLANGNPKLHNELTKEYGDDNSESSVLLVTTGPTTIQSIPKTGVIQQTTAGTVVDIAPTDVSELEEIEISKEESSIRKLATKPDTTSYFELSELVSQFKTTYKDSNQERTARPRIPLSKKDSLSAIYGSQRSAEEPILLQTKAQREQQQLQKNIDALHQSEVLVQFSKQPIPQPEPNSEQQFETAKKTGKIIDKYEALKNKELDRLRLSKIPDPVVQLIAEGLPRARIVPSRIQYQNSSVGNSFPVKEIEFVDFTRVPPSDFGQKQPPEQNISPQFDSLPLYYEFQASYPSSGKVEEQRYIYNASFNPVTHYNSNQERHRPKITYHATVRPTGNQDIYRTPEVIHLNTRPRPDELKYFRPKDNSERPSFKKDIRLEAVTLASNPMGDKTPKIVSKTSPRPIMNEEKYQIPDIIYTAPEREYLPPSAYLTPERTYPRVNNANQPVSTTIPPPPVTYEPPLFEYMPSSLSPPSRIYVPPVEEYKPPSAPVVNFQSYRKEEKTPSVIHSQRFADPRAVMEDVRKLEVSVGHPSIKQLPYPPERDDPSGSIRSVVLQPDTIDITVTENPYRSHKRAQGMNEKGERFQEISILFHGNNNQRKTTVGKSDFVENTKVVNNNFVRHERPSPNLDGFVGKPCSAKDETPIKTHLAAYPSHDRPKSGSLILERRASSNFGKKNTD